MNLTAIFLLSAALGASAKGLSQTVTLNMKNAPIQKVFREVIRQTGTSIIYNEALFKDASPITIKTRNATVTDVLNKCLQGLPFTFNIEDQAIVVKQKPAIALKSEERITAPPPINVNGNVKDENGSPLLNASIIIKGTSKGVTTNANGDFNIVVPGTNTVLIISYTGYVNQEIMVGTRTMIEISMAKADNSLNEVVVTALGIKRNVKSLGYATSTVTADQIAVNQTPNFMNALEGKIAGVNINQPSTGPGGSSKIRIRGQSSLGGQNSPLIVVNGIPIDNTTHGIGGDNPTNGTGQSDGGDGLSSINPDDVESMTVLKGAAAAALYGSRAKDGVIMITTKNKGTGKGIGVEYNLNYTSAVPLDFTDWQYEYGQGENGVRPTTPNPTSGVWSFGEKFQPGMTQMLFDGVVVPYVPVKNKIRQFYRKGLDINNTVIVSSGGKDGGFNLSFADLASNSIVPNSDFHRKIVNLGFTHNITNKLTVSGNINYSNEKNHNPPVISGNGYNIPLVINTLSTSIPMDLLSEKRFDADGNEYVYSRYRNRTNPYISAYDRFENVKRDRIFGNITARYNFTGWLYLQGRIGQDYYSRARDYNNPTGIAFLSPAPSGFVNGNYTQEGSTFREINSDFLLGATRKFHKFGVDINLGGNQRYVRADRSSVFVQDFVVKDLYTVTNGRQKVPSYTLSEKKVNSLYGTAGLSYNDYLFINVSARNDWFSTLSPANRSILYPSVTGSFVFSQAFKNIPEWISFGKIRAGYAQVGSDVDVSPYSNILPFAVNGNLFVTANGMSVPVGTISTSTIPNANLHPMSVSEVEFGMNVEMFQNRFGIDLTYYSKLSEDQILSAQISDASAFTSQLINVGKSRSNGIEVLLTGVPIRSRNFRWDISFNGAYNTSKVLKLGNSASDLQIGGNLRYVVGMPLGQIYGLGYLRDAKGRKVFNATSGNPMPTAAPIRLGSALPKYFGGINNAFNYKGINFSVLIDFKLGNDMFSQTNWNAERHGLQKETLVGREQGYVIGDGVNPDGNVNTVKTPVQQFYTIDNSGIREGFVENAGFWKLRQVTLGYDFSKMLPNSFFVKNLVLSAVASNVLILKKWIRNIDPETFSNVSDNSMGQGGDGDLPTTRNIGFSLRVKF